MVCGDETTYVSRINNATSTNTTAPYKAPTPYAQRHEPVRATTKPIAQGPRKGATINPMVHVFSCSEHHVAKQCIVK